MKRIARLMVVFALAGSTLRGQEMPSGTPGERGLMLRPLSRRQAVTNVPVTWSACGTPRIDGVLSPGEWSGASSHVITVNTLAGAVPATLSVMNDNLTLYMAIQFPESSQNYGGLVVEFDNDNDGVPFEAGDDAVVYNNRFGFSDDFRQPCAVGMCAPEDTSDFGSSEGRGAYVNDGTSSVYELSHPFTTYDIPHDLPVCGGSTGGCSATVGFFILLRQIDSGGALYDTYYPGPAIYDQINFQTCPPPVLSGCGTATTDGRIGSTEWNSAGQYRLSVRITPSGETAPGTLYLMNDSLNAFMALAFDQPAALAYNQLAVEFDNVAGTWIGDDHLTFLPANGGFFDSVGIACPPPNPFITPPCRSRDTTVGGTNDGAGALANDGTQTAVEVSHPLNGGDSNDFALSYGDTVPYRLTFMTTDQFPGTVAVTGVGWPAYGSWMICTPSPGQNVADLSQQVDRLAASGDLSPKNAETLNKDLVKANGNLQGGKLKQAARDLGNFVDDVTKIMRKGELADRLGQPLVAAANSAISNL